MGWAETFMRMDERRYYGVKVPEITLAFWVAKILSTAMGEASSDYLVSHFVPYLAVAAMACGFLLAMALQFTARRYIPALYWLLVVMVSIFGTMIADVIHVVLGVPYMVSTGLFGSGLVVILWLWNRSERSLSIHSIATPRREAFYWATVVATFALGTAAGDLTASDFGLGYLNSAFLFAGIFAVFGLGYFLFGMNEVLAFWGAYIATRPVGASLADWLDKPVRTSGLGFGTPDVASALTVAVCLSIAYISFRHRPALASSQR